MHNAYIFGLGAVVGALLIAIPVFLQARAIRKWIRDGRDE